MGIGRVLAGDIGNACYNKHHTELAKGKYPQLSALVLSFPEEADRIIGSTLCIDTRNKQGERVLVIRALNPTEAVIQRELDPVSTVKAVVQYFIDAAKASAATDPEDPVQEVHLCYDHCGGHSTNRQPVFEAEGKLLAGEWRSAPESNGLEVQAETKFNGYDIWKKGQTRVVWRAT
jgi:hypothetical protein